MGNEFRKTEQAWGAAIGQALATILKFYTFIRSLWTAKGIGPEILDWFETNEGLTRAREALETLGSQYQHAKEIDSRRFHVMVIQGNRDRVVVNMDIPPRSPLWSERLLPVQKNTGRGDMVVKRDGDEIFVGGRKLILRTIRTASCHETIDEVVNKHVKEQDGVSASILDALLEHSDFLIPKSWSDIGNNIFFTNTVYGEGMSAGFRALRHGCCGWEAIYAPVHTTGSLAMSFCIATLEPEKVSSK